MTDAEIKNLRYLMRAATPGPWVLEDKERSNLVSNGEVWVEAVVARNYQEINDAALIVAAVNALPGLLDEIERLKRACSMLNDEVSQTLGRALGYPKFCDDQKNFPGATDADGVCVGDHVAESLAAEASKEIERLRAMLSAAGCMMPPASGVIQLDTNDRIALDAAIDADMDGGPDDRQ